MTRAANAGELTKLRSHGQWARWHVIIDKPDVVYTCRSTGTLVLSSYYIPFDGASGTQTNVLKDMTVLVGSTSGGSERGITRVRIAPDGDDSDLHIGADPSFGNVQNDDYITVLNDFTPFAKPTSDVNVDFDTEYLDEFEDFVPVPVFGERVAVINAGEWVDFDASASWVPGSTISGYAWTFTGSLESTGDDTATPSAHYAVAGRYRVDLTVTAANGKSSVGYGWVYVLGDGLSPETGVIIEDLEGEYQVGWACKMIAYDRPTIKDRARVVLYSEDYFNNTAGSIGPVTDRENLLMVGWIIGETIIREPGQDYVEFTVGGPGIFCESVATMPAGLVDANYPEDDAANLPEWAKMSALTITKGLHYLINYRSTLAKVCDIYIEGFNVPAHKMVSDSESLWGQLTEYAGQGLMDVTSDRYGHIYIQRDIALMPVADRSAYPTVMTMTDADWTDELAIIRRQRGEAAMAEIEGLIYDAAAGVIIPVGGRAPGEMPSAHGDIVNISSISLISSAGVLQAAGLLMGKLNAEYESISGVHPANNHFIDVCPRQYVKFVIDGATVGAFPRRLTLRHDAESGAVALEFDCEGEGVQYSAVQIDYPDEENPPIEIPDTPPTPPPPPTDPPEEPPEASGADAVVVTGSDIRITANLNESSPTWTSIISGGPSAPLDSDMPETTNDILYVIEAESVWKCTGVTGTPSWSEVWDGASLGGGTIKELTRARVAPGSADLVYVLGYGEYGFVAGNNKPFVLRSSNGGLTWQESWIQDALPESKSYTVTHKTISKSMGVKSWPYWHYYGVEAMEFERIGDDEPGQVYNPIAVAYWAEEKIVDPSYDRASIRVEMDEDTGDCIIQDHSHTSVHNTTYGAGNYLIDWPGQTGRDALEDYFGAGSVSFWAGLNYYMPLDAGRVKFKYQGMSQINTPGLNITCTLDCWVFWNKPEIAKPTALDVARTNSNYVYVGTENKVWKSTDGGFTWAQSLAHGSNDIHVDPQLAGVYYHWAADGGLELVVNDAVSGADLDSETAAVVGLRLARDLNSGRLWALKGQTSLRVRNNAAWTDQDTGLSGARGLHCYLGGKLIYLDDSTILYSTDYGATQADKKGGWTGYGSPINAHLLRETA